MGWENRKPILEKENCVGCHLCANVCPVQCISKGEIEFKKDEIAREIIV